jgi:O-antigen/teichoic acid export membrane protein
MLKRYFLSNITILLLLNVLVKPCWIFFIDRNVQQIVGHREYGLYAALLNLSIMFNILLDYGITNYNNKTIAEDPSKLQVAIPNALIAKLIFSFLYLALMLALGFVFHYDTKAIRLLGFIAIIQLLSSFVQYLRSNISALHDFKLDSILSVMDKVLMILICGILLIHPQLKSCFVIEWFVFAQIFSYLLTFLVALYITMKRYTNIHFNYFSFSEIGVFVKKGTPYALLILLMGIYIRSDAILLERICDAEQAGIYAQAYRILDTCNILGYLFAGLLLPMFARMIAAKNSVVELVRTSSYFIFPVSFAITAFCFVFSTEIMQILYQDASSEMAFIFRMVILCFPAFSITYIYSSLLTANGDLKLLIQIAFWGAVSCVALNLIFIPMFKVKGVAVNAFIVHSLLALVFTFFATKKFQLPNTFSAIFNVLCFFLVMLLMNVILKYFISQMWLILLLNGFAFLVGVYAFQFWKKDHLFSTFRKYI